MRLRFLPLGALCALVPAAPAQAESAALTTADLSVAMTATDAQTVPSRGPFVSPVTYTVTVTNAGPDEAREIRLEIVLTGDQTVQEVMHQAGTCDTAGTVVTCNTGAITSGRADVVQLRALPASTSDLGARANVTSLSTDLHPANNFAAATPDVVVVDPFPPPPPPDTTPPDTDITAPRSSTRTGSFRLFKGRAFDSGSGVTGVEIAVQRTDGGCMSLTGPRGRFGKAQPCSERKWLRATGTTSWRYKLRRALPPGRYRVYSRATDGQSLTESAWTRSDRNVLRFTVR
jgi:hypothetical protein